MNATLRAYFKGLTYILTHLKCEKVFFKSHLLVK